MKQLMRIYILVIFAIIFSCDVIAQGEFSISFRHKSDLKKYIVKPISAEQANTFREKAPYVQSATINATLDMNGNILKVDFLERSEDEGFNKLVKERFMTTSGLWKINNAPKGTAQVNLILPFLQLTPPYDKSLNNPDLIRKFRNYHSSLAMDDIPGCQVGTCVILKEIVNHIGPRPRTKR